MPQVIALPMPGMPELPIPFQANRKQIIAVQAPQAQQAHLVTPDLEAHSEHMTHLGELILLEGEVRLTCHKGGQRIRIEAHRVLLNMKDGTFTVESNLRPARTTATGLQRTSSTWQSTERVHGVNPAITNDAPCNGGLEEKNYHRMSRIPMMELDAEVPYRAER